jgi:hypothetical protein
MGELTKRIIETLVDRRDRILEGKINCIPLPFKRYRNEWPGLEQGRYYLVSGSTKAAKTQLSNYLFVYNTVMWTYRNPGIIHPKIFYFPLEETAENITLRFMAFLIHHLTKGKVTVSPTDLKSTDSRFPLTHELLSIMRSEEFQMIMDHYESIVTFYDSRNVVGINKTMCDYAKTHGKTFFKTIQVREVDELGITREVERKLFDYYVPDDKDEYIIFIVDHVSLLEPVKGASLRETICTLSENCVSLRNRYNYIPVIVQQQSAETQNAEAVKNNKVRPTVSGLGDAKYTARDCDLMLGICNPHAYEIPQYYGYDITTLKGNIRFLETVINRHGEANGICPLLFNGAINEFTEAPHASDTEELKAVYNRLEKARAARRERLSTVLFAWAGKVINNLINI